MISLADIVRDWVEAERAKTTQITHADIARDWVEAERTPAELESAREYYAEFVRLSDLGLIDPVRLVPFDGVQTVHPDFQKIKANSAKLADMLGQKGA